MRIPVPTNRLVAFTLVGAVLTGVVAVGLAVPGLFPATDGDDTATDAGTTTVAADAPTPNPDFTPAVQQDAGYEEHDDDHGEYGEYDDHDDDDDDEHEG